jgi:hypothetical protein
MSYELVIDAWSVVVDIHPGVRIAEANTTTVLYTHGHEQP